PSRLHFGMFSFGARNERQFGGVGVMIDAPGLELTVTAADVTSAAGPMSEQSVEIARRVLHALGKELHALGNAAPAGCRIEIAHAPRPHVGLGSGTQLALSIAAALDALSGHEPRLPDELARLAGRARRSGIGTHGFFRGGLLVDPGKLDENEVPPLVTAVMLPASWRFVLLCPRQAVGLSGDAEREAFGRLPPVPASRSAELCKIAMLELVPEAMAGNFDRFSEALEAYGRLAGECFASQQGGSYTSAAAMPMLRLARQLGVQGVAQSSWGPTIAALLDDSGAAEHFATQVRRQDPADTIEIVVAAPAEQGALVQPALNQDPTPR
ncbi:MAG TPA: hypothetical protein VHV77_06015, partial [Pirellulales bacterium]|nr:hypothetical protein [Pirellulales bacterium]